MAERYQISEANVIWRAPLIDGHAVEVRRRKKPITSTMDAAGVVPSGRLRLLDREGKVIKRKKEPVSLAHAPFVVHEEDFEVKEWKDEGLEMLLEKLIKSA